MDDINFEPDCTQLFEQSAVTIWRAITEAKLLYTEDRKAEFTPRQVILMAIVAGAKVVRNTAEAELNIDQQVNDILGR